MILGVRALDSCQFFDYRPDGVAEDSFVALISHSAEVEQQPYYLDNSQFEFLIVHFENLSVKQYVNYLLFL